MIPKIGDEDLTGRCGLQDMIVKNSGLYKIGVEGSKKRFDIYSGMNNCREGSLV